MRRIGAGVLLALVLTTPASASTGRVLVSLDRADRGDVEGFLHRTGLRRAGPVVPEIGLVTVAAPASASGIDALVGVASVELFAARNGGPARRVATLTAPGTVRVRARRAARYAFSSIAVDHAGNREDAPARPDALTRVLKPLRRRR